MAYTTINKSTDYFNTKLYTGNGGTNAITGVGHQPDWNWIKCRSHADSSQIFDVLRTTYALRSDGTNAEAVGNGWTSLDSDGFTLNGDSSGGNVNNSGRTYASWNWKANGAGSSNSDGDITSTVSANTTAGFSIVKFTANGTNNGTIGHGLGVAPKVVLYKRTDSTGSWYWLYKYVDGSLDFLQLDSTAAKTDLTLGTYGFTTSTTFTNLGLGNGQEIIAYCFAEKTGYSKFGSYTGSGNATQSPFIYTGFKPAFILCKDPNYAAENWFMFDNKRPGYNVNANLLYANDTATETTSGANQIDLLSNGFKMRATNNGMNRSGSTFIYMAFGQSIVGSNNVPCTAR
jgi:hypothetical protein